MGEVGKTGDRALLRLGAQMAEVEALFACVLAELDAQAERRALMELAGAGTRLAELAGTLAAGQAPLDPPRPPRPRRAPARRRAAATRRPARTKLERRI
ncbi:hypothetical protein, partial [Actinomadura rugatobispora]